MTYNTHTEGLPPGNDKDNKAKNRRPNEGKIKCPELNKEQQIRYNAYLEGCLKYVHIWEPTEEQSQRELKYAEEQSQRALEYAKDKSRKSFQ
jgi:hypothetical protein